MFQQLVVNFANFLRNNNAFMEKKIVHFKKYQSQDKFIFQQLVVNFTDFQRNDSIIIQKKSCAFKKNIICEESLYFDN